MKELAQAIHALNISRPWLPRVEELEEVIGRYMPSEPPGEQVTRIVVSMFDYSMRLLLSPCTQRDSAFLDSIAQKLTPTSIILYADGLLLVDPTPGACDAAGKYLNTPLLCAACYDQTCDVVTGHAIREWFAVRAIAPAAYAKLTDAWQNIKQATP